MQLTRLIAQAPQTSQTRARVFVALDRRLRGLVGGVREAILLTAQNQELLTLGDGRLLSSKDSCCTSPETFFREKHVLIDAAELLASYIR